MERTYVADALKKTGETVCVRGFIDNLRDSKYMTFIVLKDITGKVQITIEKEQHPDWEELLSSLTGDS
ncbi:MAG: aspartate--tRNA(Asn) ligase, partial [Lachnospiraceae bacterium]|nr:aspartate--tRNA(Asn) ligase [Lachnospiraceae bacterium]